MPTVSLKDYQREAIDELKIRIKECLNSTNKKVVLKAPTGSGKTCIMASVFEELHQEMPNANYAVFWCSIGKSQLQVQSYRAVKKIL